MSSRSKKRDFSVSKEKAKTERNDAGSKRFLPAKETEDDEVTGKVSVPLEEIIDQIHCAVPFEKKNVKDLRFYIDENAKWGEIFQCLDLNEEERPFLIKGTVESIRNMTLAPSAVPMHRRSHRVNVDRYTVSVMLGEEDAESVSKAVQELFIKMESEKVAEQIALKMKMRKTKEEFKENPSLVSFTSVYQGTDTMFTTSRAVARKGEKLDQTLLPPAPAGLPSKKELQEADVRFPRTHELLPLVPVFQSSDKDTMTLVDARKISIPPEREAKIIFRIKQDAWLFTSKSGEEVERIHLECSPIAVVLSEVEEKVRSPASKIKRRRLSSF